MQGPLSLDIEDGIALVTLDDGKANALSPTMVEALDSALDQASGAARALVIAGRPGRFCAGFDLRVMMSGPDAARALVESGARLLMRIYAHPKPVVVACTGHALAGGALLVLTGDTRLGVPGAFKIGLNEVQAGIPLPIFAHALARDRLDVRAVTAAALQSRIVDPEAAVREGWLDRLSTSDQLLSDALAEAHRLARLSPRAYELTKFRLRQPLVEHVLATLDDDLRQALAP